MRRSRDSKSWKLGAKSAVLGFPQVEDLFKTVGSDRSVGWVGSNKRRVGSGVSCRIGYANALWRFPPGLAR
jgi:hypothetical protein